MTDEQINIAIAESLEWTEILHHKRPEHMRQSSDQSDCIITGQNSKGGRSELPNYTSDLNAMHEVKKTLSDAQKRKWGEIAVEILNNRHNQDIILYCKNPISGENVFAAANLEASQEAEIYLRTLGKWKDTDHA